MVERDYLARYPAIWMNTLVRGYFNQQASAEKFEKLQKYQIRLRPEDRREIPKTICYTYRNKKNQKFGVFIPTHIDENPANELPGLTILLKQALGFLIDYRDKHRTRLEDEFFLLPLIDNANKHWGVLKIKLTRNNVFKATYYDPAFFKRNAIYAKVSSTIRSMLNVTTKAPDLLQQIDPFNCGPLSFNMIETLAEGEEPSVLPVDPCSCRNDHYLILVAASRVQAEFEADSANTGRSGPFPQLDVNKPYKPFWVRHRGIILIAAVSLTVALAVGLIILFPPAALVPAIGAVGAATSFSSITMAALGATIVGASTAFVSLASSLIIDGAKSLWRTLTGKNKPRPEFSYDVNENGFASVGCTLSDNAKQKMAQVRRRTDALQMSFPEEEEPLSASFRSPIAPPSQRRRLSVEDFELTLSSQPQQK